MEGPSSPDLLLRAILDRSSRRDFESIRQFVYPAPGFPPRFTSQDLVVEVMKQGRGISYTGDFSYSDRALQLILDHHMHRFVRLTDSDSFWLRRASEGGLVDAELWRLTGGDPHSFQLFDYKGCHILIVEIDGCWKLVFWEGMNHLIEEDAPR